MISTPSLPFPFVPGATELPMLDVYLPMMKTAALISAGQLGLFEVLASKPLDLPQLAKALECSVDGVHRLTDFLVTLGYLERDGAKLCNSQHTQRWFTGAGEVNYTAGLHWTSKAWSLMETLTHCVRTGSPTTVLWDLMQGRASWGPTFSSYMHSFAHHLSPDLLFHVKLDAGVKRMLDLGGSHGQHAIAFCKQYPELQGVLVDQASALTETYGTLRGAGLSHRISLTAGDLREAAWGTAYDLVLFLSVLHNQSSEENRQTVVRIASVLNPGGVLVIHDYPDDDVDSAYNSAFRLTLLTETGTRIARSSEIENWVVAAGLLPPEVIPLSPREKGTLFLARKAH